MATAIIVEVSTGVMKLLLCKLSKLLEEEYVKLKGVHKEIKFLRDELSTMSATLQMLADAEELNPQMRDWRDRLRELAYDVEDCVDAFVARTNNGRPPKGFKEFFRKLKKLKVQREIANEVEELKKRAMEASERHKRYKFVKLVSNSSTYTVDPRLPALYEEVDKLVGIHRPKELILKWFNEEEEDSNLKVLSVVGSGGIGKTTIANQVYYQLKCQFKCTAFISVSRNPHPNVFFRQMLTEMGITEHTSHDERQLVDLIRDHLKDKRYFIVIDDLWSTEAWKAIRLAFFNNKRGSRVIVTTRNAAVALFCSSDSGYVYQMQALSFADSKRLFCKRAFGSEELSYPHLEEVCDKVLAKCGGLPLAIITLSSLLADQLAEDEWRRVLTAIGRTLAKDPDCGNMTKILSFSYFDLPHHLRTCLLYLSVFPEDSLIAKQRLINRWIAEGFIHEESGRNAYEVGERYFNELINRSLIQPVDVKYGQVKGCGVHDIILDFIICKAAEENFVTLLDDAEHGQISDYRVRRLCVNNRNKKLVTLSSSLILSHIRSLSICGDVMQTSLFAFASLRVLDLEDCWHLRDYHLADIDKLFHLRFLCIQYCKIAELPRKMGKLQYLEMLDIRGTRIEELPSALTKLRRLARLYVDPRTRFPHAVIRQMWNLEELAQFGLYSCEVGKSLQEFGLLSKLRTLEVSFCFDWLNDSEGESQVQDIQTYVGALISSCNFHHLYIRDNNDSYSVLHPLSLDSWCPAAPCSLRKLHITEVKAEVCQALNIMIESLNDKYLGLPALVGADRSDCFRHLVDRVRQRINGWREKTLSMGGKEVLKEVLIKSIAQAVPVYAMMVLKIPQNICKGISDTIGQYWWGDEEDHRKIH